MMGTLYEIDNEIMSCFDAETGEVLDHVKLDSLMMARTDKVESVALWIKNLYADAQAYRAEKEAFAKREKEALTKIDSLKEWLAWALGGEKFSTWRCAVSFRKSERVEIIDPEKIPQEMLVTTTSVKPDKDAIKAAIKDGKAVDGCTLITRMNPTIK